MVTIGVGGKDGVEIENTKLINFYVTMIKVEYWIVSKLN